MKSVFESLVRRRSELRGQIAASKDVDALAVQLTDVAFSGIVEAYRALPVSWMNMDFVVDDHGNAQSPGPDFMEDYDPGREYSILWMTPAHIIEDIVRRPRGRIVYAAGFLPFGMCPMGGDGYYLRFSEVSSRLTPLYRVYLDWVDPRSEGRLLPEAQKLVCQSFESVIGVARFEAGP